MFNRDFVLLFCWLFVLGGCTYNDEPMPRITEVIQPCVLKPTGESANVDKNIPRDWLPSSRVVERKWRAVVMHHSLTEVGNAAVFDNYHKNGHHWKGIGYDFVIGNGKGSGDGQVEVTFRWRRQIAGAHCGGTPKNWANESAVGICLVGDFSRSVPTSRQMRSLVKLIRFLQNRYNIPKSRIYGHKDTPGYTGGTGCPGNFPMARLKSMLDF